MKNDIKESQFNLKKKKKKVSFKEESKVYFNDTDMTDNSIMSNENKQHLQVSDRKIMERIIDSYKNKHNFEPEPNIKKK